MHSRSIKFGSAIESQSANSTCTLLGETATAVAKNYNVVAGLLNPLNTFSGHAHVRRPAGRSLSAIGHGNAGVWHICTASLHFLRAAMQQDEPR